MKHGSNTERQLSDSVLNPCFIRGSCFSLYKCRSAGDNTRMDRSNHYEAAFEAYLQWHRLCYVAVDESRRAQLGDVRVKNLDFIVYGDAGARLLVDIKGRRFPTGAPGKQRRVWECWSTQDDVTGLACWSGLFGPGYLSLLVFVYQVLPDEPLADDSD